MKREIIASQRGATLITALVMLVVLTLLVISAISSSTTNLRIAGNMQMQAETVSAAQQAAENVISYDFTKLLVPQTITVTLSTSQKYDVQIPVPVCTGSSIMKRDTPNLPQVCLGSSDPGGGIVYESGAAAAPDTQCAAQQWDVRAAVTDPNSGAQTTLHQGVSLLVDSTTPCNVQLP